MLALALAVWLPLAWLAQPPGALALNDAQQLVVEAWRLVNQSYVAPDQLEAVHWRQRRQKALERPIESSAAAYDAIEALLAPLGDPYTRLLRPPEYEALRSTNRGSVSGVGLQLGLRDADHQVVVIAPLDGSPAAEAGIASGTELLRVEGRSSEELGLDGTAALLRGPAGSDVLLDLRTPTGRSREVRLERRAVDLHPVRQRLLVRNGHRLGVLRLTQFSEPVPTQVREALEALSDQDIEGLVLDLRNNSGGLVSAGIAVANAFLDGDPIVETQDRGGIAARQQATPGRLYGGPMLTLVNGGTASASEILAGALQDAGRSELAGTSTFGKGLIQTLLSLGDGSGLAVTVARYLTPSGRDIQHLGIVPEHQLSSPEPLNPGGEGDDWLDQTADLLVAQMEAPRG
ncbi:S41 family peptidase [Cyanobium sp. FGCU-6]|nr:S41 family peptidase [Cyanobium sp. FGCU6]